MSRFSADYDRGMIERLRRRDPAVVREIVDQNARRLYRAARGMGLAPPDAEDVSQDVFVTFLATLDRFEGRSQVSTWLIGILHHKVQERRRSLAKDDMTDPIEEAFESRFDRNGKWLRPPIAPDQHTTSVEIRAALERCLDGLPPIQREVFQLRQVEELSAQEVSNILGRTVTYIGVLFHRARLRLQQCLDQKGWNPTS